jgi:hypothetical protein
MKTCRPFSKRCIAPSTADEEQLYRHLGFASPSDILLTPTAFCDDGRPRRHTACREFAPANRLAASLFGNSGDLAINSFEEIQFDRNAEASSCLGAPSAIGSLPMSRPSSPPAEPQPVDDDPVLAALAQAPRVSRLTPEQRAELDEQVADIKAGKARLVRHEDLPAALEELYRAEHGG